MLLIYLKYLFSSPLNALPCRASSFAISCNVSCIASRSFFFASFASSNFPAHAPFSALTRISRFFWWNRSRHHRAARRTSPLKLARRPSSSSAGMSLFATPTTCSVAHALSSSTTSANFSPSTPQTGHLSGRTSLSTISPQTVHLHFFFFQRSFYYLVPLHN